MTEERFLYLLELFKNNQLSQEGWEELSNAISGNDYDHLLEDDFSHLLIDEERDKIYSWTPEKEPQTGNRILNSYKLQPVAAVPLKCLPHRIHTIVTPVLLLVLATGSWQHFKWGITGTSLHRVKIVKGNNSTIPALGKGEGINPDTVANVKVHVFYILPASFYKRE